MTTYDNPIPAAGLNSRKLRSEVFASLALSNQVMWSGSTPTPGTWPTSGTCHVDFGAASLTGPQQTTLTSLVAAHTPGAWTDYPTLAQMALEPGTTGQLLWVPDASIAGGLMLYDGTIWRQGSSRQAFRKTKSGAQPGIDGTPTNITGLDIPISAGYWEGELLIIYQATAVTAAPAIDFVAISSDVWIAETLQMKTGQASSASSGVAYLAGTTDPTQDIGAPASLSATNPYLIRVKFLVHATSSTTIQPRIWSLGTGTITAQGNSTIYVKELPQ